MQVYKQRNKTAGEAGSLGGKCRLFSIGESSAHVRGAREGSVEAEEVETKGAKAQGWLERTGRT